MNGERKAALALASLAQADRAWLLERLPEEPRARVSALLGELSEMRVSFDRELLRQLGSGQEETQERHEPVDPAAAALALESEPDWAAALVQRRHPSRGVPRITAKALAAIVAAFEARVREAAAAPRPAPARPFWRRRLAWR